MLIDGRPAFAFRGVSAGAGVTLGKVDDGRAAPKPAPADSDFMVIWLTLRRWSQRLPEWIYKIVLEKHQVISIAYSMYIAIVRSNSPRITR